MGRIVKEKVGPPYSKKQKASSSAGLKKKSSLRAEKSQLRRQISSSSEQSWQKTVAPTFHQPHSNESQSVGPHPDRLMAHEAGDLDEEPDEDDEDEEDKEDVEENILTCLEKYSESERNRAIGKIFALKIWPWPSSDWWIGQSEELTLVPVRNDENMGEVLAVSKKNLNLVMKEQFHTFLTLDMGILMEDWTQKVFKTQVTTLHLIL